MLKVCVVVDTEAFISFKQGNPMWTAAQRIKAGINYLLRNVRYDKKGFKKLYRLAVHNEFPITFMLVGSVFKPAGKRSFIEFGYHSYSHKALTFLSDDELGEEIRNIYRADSFSPPIWMIEDTKNPERIFRALKREGYTITIYRGKITGITPASTITKGIFKPVMKYGIKALYVSSVFSDKSSPADIGRILQEIQGNAGKDAVYCLTTHDFANKNLENFSRIVQELKAMEKKKLIKLITVRQAAQ